MFDAKKVKNECVAWIRDWFEENGPGRNAVIGISGGKDSSIVAALCVEALGKDRVIGVLMPQNVPPVEEAHLLCDFLGIRKYICPIRLAVDEMEDSLQTALSDGENAIEISGQTRINLPARIRMAMLYAVSQSVNGRVSNNCNLSEDWVGYSTRWGDSVGDFSPLCHLTVTEVKEIGYALNLPPQLIERAPDDGLCGKTDEDNLGFTYEVLDRYIRTGICEDQATKQRIDALHRKNRFKLEPVPAFRYHHTEP